MFEKLIEMNFAVEQFIVLMMIISSLIACVSTVFLLIILNMKEKEND